jgi:hypothetical protein
MHNLYTIDYNNEIQNKKASTLITGGQYQTEQFSLLLFFSFLVIISMIILKVSVKVASPVKRCYYVNPQVALQWHIR